MMAYSMLVRGVSDAAFSVDEAVKQNNYRLSASATFTKQPAYDELGEQWNECRTENWDCHGALAVEQDTLQNTYLFIEAMPLGTPLPSVGAEPDGHLTLEWYRNPRWTLSLSIGPEGTLYYASLFGAEDIRGSAPFRGDVPDILLGLIRRVSET